MSAEPDRELQRLEAAAQWLVRLRDNADDESLVAEWLAWCEAAPGNLDAFQRIEDTWQAVAVAVTPPAAARPAAQPRPITPAPRRHRHSVRSFAKAASLLLALGLVAMLVTRPPWFQGTQTLSTPVAIHGSSPLPDGSRVELGARSRITTHFSDKLRRVVIESGEAYFEVAHDKTRPFVVEAGGLTVTAVGTAFNVRRGGERVVVTVSEGRVRLAPEAGAPRVAQSQSKAPVEAGAGEQATYSKGDGRIALALADPAVAVAWREGVLKFVQEPLDEVVADLNRYSTRQIVLADPRLGQLRYTGTVFGNRLDDWLNAVESVFPLRVTYDGPDRIVLEPIDAKMTVPSAAVRTERFN